MLAGAATKGVALGSEDTAGAEAETAGTVATTFADGVTAVVTGATAGAEAETAGTVTTTFADGVTGTAVTGATGVAADDLACTGAAAGVARPAVATETVEAELAVAAAAEA